MAQEDPVKDLKDTLQEICCQLQEDQVPHEVVEGFILEEFLPRLAHAVEKIGHNAKRICLAFVEPPAPTPLEVAGLIARMKGACLEVLTIFAELPRCQDNKEAVCSVLANHYEFIQDAVDELRESMDEDEALAVDMPRMPVRNGFNQTPVLTWSGEDRELLIPGMGLVKTVRITMRKVSAVVNSRGRCINMQENTDLDRIADLFQTSSSFMDDFITSLYPPLFATTVQESGTALKGHVLAILKATKESHFYNAAREDWVGFLEHATEHNYQNLISRIALR
ncbi:cyclin-D1-binding protein 1 homolog isoform X3 [Dermacentor albipictus]|uniref:cyclin-D1-binding protein 1 homolog isoform X3 n=1 Tax=Dermacentor albipictus TaxID=60249 RepID=UPI0038FCDE08